MSDDEEVEHLIGPSNVMAAIVQRRAASAQVAHVWANDVVDHADYRSEESYHQSDNLQMLSNSAKDGPLSQLHKMADAHDDLEWDHRGAFKGAVPFADASLLLYEIVKAKAEETEAGVGLSKSFLGLGKLHFFGFSGGYYSNHVGVHDPTATQKATAIIPAQFVTQKAEIKWPALYKVYDFIRGAIGKPAFQLLSCNVLFGISKAVAFEYHQDSREHPPKLVHLSVCCELSDSGSSMRIAGATSNSKLRLRISNPSPVPIFSGTSPRLCAAGQGGPLEYDKIGTFFAFDSSLWHRSGRASTTTIKICFFFELTEKPVEGKWNEIVAKFSRKKVNLAKRGLEEDPRAYGGSPEAKVHVCEGASSSSATLPLAKKRKVEAEAAAVSEVVAAMVRRALQRVVAAAEGE